MPDSNPAMTHVLAESQPLSVTSCLAPRIAALDWTKGALVIWMVIYHAINYSAFTEVAYRFLAFLPPSFILIAGFLVGQVYAMKYDLSTWKPYVRLAIRGMKLFVLVAVLNAAYCVGAQHGLISGITEFGARSRAIFLSGNGRAGIFEVLLPIAYFLLFAPVLLWLRSRTSRAIVLCAAVVFLLCLGLELSGRPLQNLSLLSVGVVGMAFGLIPLATIDRVATKWAPVLLCYLCYRVISYAFGEPYPVQTLAAAVSVLLLYCCALHLENDGWFGRQMVLLGQYSLLGYLVQITWLRAAVKLCGRQPETVAGVVILVLFTTAGTLLAVQAVHRLRRRIRSMDFVYKAVFA